MNTSRNAACATKTYWKRFRASQFGHISHYWITRESKSLIRIDRPAICFRIRQIKSRSASLDWNRICACRLGSLFVQLQKLKDHMAPHPTANLTFLKQLWALIGQWCLKQRSRFSSPSHEPEPDSRGVTSQELETSELEQIQSAHTEWLASNGKSRQRADLRNRIVPTEWLGNLSKADLRGACILPRRYADNVNALFEGANLRDATIKESHLGKSFIGTDLSRATWTGACLCNADLSEAVLVEANLSRADFTGANLSGANLKDACLRDANLENTYGLLAVALRGADVGNAKLPPAIAAFDALKTVEASSQNAAKVFILLLAACSYAWLTVATATDAGLLTNSGTSKWPIIQTEVPIVWFFWIAPLILLCIYVYLHVYLQRLWEVLSDLPAVFPDGRPLDKRTYPWLLNDLVRADFTRLRGSQPLLGCIQRVLSIFLAWWLMPLTLLVFWVRYLPKHSWLGTGFHVLLFHSLH